MTQQPFEEEFAPRLKASQRVAAKRRLRAAQKIAQAPRAAAAAITIRPEAIIAIGFVVFAVLIGLAVATNGGFQRPLPIASPAPTGAPVASPSTAPAGAWALPTAPAAPTAAPSEQTVMAYGAPGGTEIGPVELSRANAAAPVAQCPGWIRAKVDGSGLVWFQAGDVQLAATGPDLCVPASAVPQTGQGAPSWSPPGQAAEQPAEATPVPATAECTEATAPYVVYRKVNSNGQEVGNVVAFSCESLADAEAKANGQEAAIRRLVLTTAMNAAAPVVLDTPLPTPGFGPGGGGGGSW